MRRNFLLLFLFVVGAISYQITIYTQGESACSNYPCIKYTDNGYGNSTHPFRTMQYAADLVNFNSSISSALILIVNQTISWPNGYELAATFNQAQNVRIEGLNGIERVNYLNANGGNAFLFQNCLNMTLSRLSISNWELYSFIETKQVDGFTLDQFQSNSSICSLYDSNSKNIQVFNSFFYDDANSLVFSSNSSASIKNNVFRGTKKGGKPIDVKGSSFVPFGSIFVSSSSFLSLSFNLFQSVGYGVFMDQGQLDLFSNQFYFSSSSSFSSIHCSSTSSSPLVFFNSDNTFCRTKLSRIYSSNCSLSSSSFTNFKTVPFDSCGFCNGNFSSLNLCSGNCFDSSPCSSNSPKSLQVGFGKEFPTIEEALKQANIFDTIILFPLSSDSSSISYYEGPGNTQLNLSSTLTGLPFLGTIKGYLDDPFYNNISVRCNSRFLSASRGSTSLLLQSLSFNNCSQIIRFTSNAVEAGLSISHSRFQNTTLLNSGIVEATLVSVNATIQFEIKNSIFEDIHITPPPDFLTSYDNALLINTIYDSPSKTSEFLYIGIRFDSLIMNQVTLSGIARGRYASLADVQVTSSLFLNVTTPFNPNNPNKNQGKFWFPNSDFINVAIKDTIFTSIGVAGEERAVLGCTTSPVQNTSISTSRVFEFGPSVSSNCFIGSTILDYSSGDYNSCGYPTNSSLLPSLPPFTSSFNLLDCNQNCFTSFQLDSQNTCCPQSAISCGLCFSSETCTSTSASNSESNTAPGNTSGDKTETSFIIQPNEESNNGLSTGGKIAIGVVIGIVGLLAIAGVLFYFLIHKKKGGETSIAMSS